MRIMKMLWPARRNQPQTRARDGSNPAVVADGPIVTMNRPTRLGQIVGLRNHRIHFFRINSQILDRFVDYGPLDLAVGKKFVESRQSDEARIHLEEFSQRRPPFAAAKTVRAESRQPPRHP